MDSAVVAAFSPHQISGGAQPASPSEATAAGSFSHQ